MDFKTVRFPRFHAWPPSKLRYLREMSSHDRDQGTDDDTIEITQDIEEQHPQFTCDACKEVFRMNYDGDKESWVFVNCVIHADLILHRGLCYQWVLREPLDD
ncbi:FirrV-1-B16 [Feldmannia irregularis virus a]|uniref:FirrV-1-B16 n=1 Tax=Feldmannia irregularis virus a TaxID=231992 RepID=Q6XM20_9PHYC|nr:FirrV-1-B16 [Feldmannia irregularis virus a]AAR26891.1 FirrV-1-B16 [Feldmannia irregularis virus a]